MTTLFESRRTFQLWRAVVGHNQLLLRSTKSESEPTRIEILFKPVRALELRTVLDGLRIRLANPDEAEQIAIKSGDPGNWATFFVLESDTWSGYVVAETMVSAEDDGEYSDPSSLLVG